MTAVARSGVNFSFDCDAPGARPNRLSAGQAASTKRFSAVSAFGAMSVADDLQAFRQEQRRPARADDAGPNDGDAANRLVG